LSEQETLIAQFDQSQRDFDAAIEGLSEERATDVWCGSWGVREIVAHIAGWQWTMAQVLEQLAKGERPAVEGFDLNDTDGTNAKFAQWAGGSSYSDALTGLGNSRNLLIHAIRALPDDRLVEGRTAHRIISTLVRHPGEHTDEIRAWRESTSS
jgi:hypothetical protein